MSEATPNDVRILCDFVSFTSVRNPVPAPVSAAAERLRRHGAIRAVLGTPQATSRPSEATIKAQDLEDWASELTGRLDLSFRGGVDPVRAIERYLRQAYEAGRAEGVQSRRPGQATAPVDVIEIPESFTELMQLCKSRYRVERTERFVNFVREFWDGKAWERSYFADGIMVPTCVADAVASALCARPDYPQPKEIK